MMATLQEDSLPVDVDAEEQIIAYALDEDPIGRGELLKAVEPSDFASQERGAIWDIMRRLMTKHGSSSIDVAMVRDRVCQLKARNAAEIRNVLEHILGSVTDHLPVDPGNTVRMEKAATVKRKASQRTGIRAGVAAVQAFFQPDCDPGATADQFRTALPADPPQEGVDESLTALNWSRYADWPDPMGKAAYIGPIGAFVNKLASETEAAREALLVQALVGAGSEMGRHAYFMVEADEHHTNLDAVMVGGTGARKGTALGRVKRFLERANAGWVQDHIVNGLSTGEGLINVVRDEEPLIPDRVALAIESEFASVFKVKGREGNTLSTVLRQAWDGDTLRSMTKNAPLKATGAHISIIGHITPDELRRLMTDTDASNGFANRILWVCVRRARYLPHGGKDVNLDDEEKALNEGIRYGRQAGGIERDDEANALWESRYRELSSGRPGLLGAVTNRAEAQVIRLSLIYALLDCSDRIKRRHLEAALAVWDYCLASARFLFGAALGDALAEELDTVLTDHGAEGMSRTAIYKHFSSNRSADDIARALGVLAGQGRAEKRRVKGDGGRAVDRWYTTYDANNVNNGFSGPPGEIGESSLFALNTLNTLNTSYVASDGGVPAQSTQRPTILTFLTPRPDNTPDGPTKGGAQGDAVTQSSPTLSRPDVLDLSSEQLSGGEVAEWTRD